MYPFMFVVKCIPLPRNKNYRLVRQALVHIWVFDNSVDDAQKRALDYIKSLDWNPLSVEHALSISSEQIPHLHKDEAVLYQKASLYGIAADFLASPLRDKSPDSPVEYGRP